MEMNAAKDALVALGLKVTDESVLQMSVLAESLQIYQDRDTKYGSAWKRLGALNNLTRMSTKVERLLEMYWHQRDYVESDSLDLDDAYDLINYCAFFIRQAKLGKWTRDRS